MDSFPPWEEDNSKKVVRQLFTLFTLQAPLISDVSEDPAMIQEQFQEQVQEQVQEEGQV